MISKLPTLLVSTALSVLLLLVACNRNEKNKSSKPQSTQLEREYLLLQKKYQELQSRVIKLQQETDAFKADKSAITDQENQIVSRLTQPQQKLNHLQREYQTLQKDYAGLEKSIAPLAAQLKSTVAAHRKELIGTELGNLTLANGRQLQQAKVTDITDQHLRLKFASGWVNVPYDDLPTAIQKRFFIKGSLVSSEALLGKTPQNKTPPPAPKSTNGKTKNSSPMEEAFAERHRRELKQYRLSIQPRITSLQNKLSAAKQKILNLGKERIKTSQFYSRRSGSIKRSPVDRDNALKKIDDEVQRLELAIQVAEGQIKSWQKELKPATGNDK